MLVPVPRTHFVHQTRPPVLAQGPAAAAAAGRSEQSRLESHHTGSHQPGSHHSGPGRCRKRDLVVHLLHLLRLRSLLGSVQNRHFGTPFDSDLEELLGRVRRKAGILSHTHRDLEVLQRAPLALPLVGLLLQELVLVLVLAVGPLLVRGRGLGVLEVLEEAQEDLIPLGQLWARRGRLVILPLTIAGVDSVLNRKARDTVGM